MRATGEMTTQINVFDLQKKSAKIGTLYADKLLVGGGWKPFSVSITSVTFAGTKEFRYRVDGTTLYVKGGLNAISSTGVPGVYVMNLPPGCTAKSASFPGYCCGAAYVAGTIVMGVGNVYLYSTTSFAIQYQDSATTVAPWGNSSNANIRVTAATGVTMGCDFSVELDPTCAACANLIV